MGMKAKETDRRIKYGYGPNAYPADLKATTCVEAETMVRIE